MQESFLLDNWNAMDDVRYYDDCDDSAVGDATCDSGRAASLVTSTSSSPDQQPQRAVLEGFSSPPNSAQSRHKNPSKMKLLVRSHALCEAASPPPDSPLPNSPCDEAANQCLDPAAEGLNKTRPRFKQVGLLPYTLCLNRFVLPFSYHFYTDCW